MLGQRHIPAARPSTTAFTAASLAVAADGSTYVVDGKSSAVYAYVAAAPWTAEGGTFSSIAAANDGSVWAVDGSSGAFARFEDAWTPLARPTGATLTQVGAGSEWDVWGITTDWALWSYDVSSNTWRATGSSARSVSATDDGSAWALTATGQPLRYARDEQSWEQVDAPEAFSSLGAGTAGWVWAVGAAGKVWQYDAGDAAVWVAVEQAPPGTPIAIHCGADLAVWVLARDDHQVARLYSYDLAAERWSELPALPGGDAFHDISVPSAANAWCLGATGSYRFTGAGGAWRSIPVSFRLDRIAAASASVLWGLTGAEVCRSTDGSQSWGIVQGAPALRAIAAASDGTVVGVDLEGHIMRYVPATSAWTNVAAPFFGTQIATGGAGTIVAIANTSAPYRYDATAATWSQQSSQLQCTSLACAADGTTLAVNADSRVFAQFDVDVWFLTALRARDVAVGSAADVWLVLPDGTPSQVAEGVPLTAEGHVQGEGSIRPRWATDDPFDESKSTHLWILRRAATLAQQQGTQGQRIYRLVNPVVGHEPGDTFHNSLYQGLYDADYKAPYNNPAAFGKFPTYTSHFFDATTGCNYLFQSSPTALTEGLSHFEAAVLAYQRQNLPTAGYELGLAMHYFTDTTQPMHAAGFANGMSAPWPMYHSNMEDAVLEYQSAVTPPSAYVPAAEMPPRRHFIEASWRAKSYSYDLGLHLATQAYAGFWGLWPKWVRNATPAILRDAVLASAWFLVRWMQAVEASVALALTADTAELRQMCCLDAAGILWHQIWPSAGGPSGWQRVDGQVQPDPGAKAAVACATNAGKQLYVLVTLPQGRSVSFAVRESSGAWQSTWKPVTSQLPSQAGTLGPVACACDGQGQLQAATIDASGTLWHALMSPQGTWTPNWGSVAGAAANDPGAKAAVACAGDPQGLHMLAVAKRDGTPWYTFRLPSGAWQAWLALNSVLGPNLRGLRDVAIALDSAGPTLHVLAVDGDGVLWYAQRTDTSWSGTWARVDRLTAGTRREALVRAAATANLNVLGSDENLGMASMALRAGGATGAWQQGWWAAGQPSY